MKVILPVASLSLILIAMTGITSVSPVFGANSISNSTELQQNCDSTSSCTDFATNSQILFGGDSNNIAQTIIQKEHCVHQSGCVGDSLNALGLFDGSQNNLESHISQKDRCSNSSSLNSAGNGEIIVGDSNIVGQLVKEDNSCSGSNCVNTCFRTFTANSTCGDDSSNSATLLVAEIP